MVDSKSNFSQVPHPLDTAGLEWEVAHLYWMVFPVLGLKRDWQTVEETIAQPAIEMMRLE